MAEIQPRRPIRVVTTLTGETGLYSGEIVIVFVAGTTPALHIWDEPSGAWNNLVDVTENVDFAGTLDVTGNATFDSPVTMSSTVRVTGVGTFLAGSTNGDAAAVRKSAKVTVTATQLRKLAAAPKELVADPGDGFALVFLGALLQYRGTTVFDSVGAGEDLQVRYTNGSGGLVSQVVDTGNGGKTNMDFASADDDDYYVGPLAEATVTQSASLVLDNIGAGELASTDDDSDGNAILTVNIDYLLVTVEA